MKPMKELPFVFVPGAYHGAWCFEKLIAGLERRGARAKGVDLPLCPDRVTPVTMEDCMRAMDAAIPEELGRVVLCGHSMGGHFISAFAERRPERVAGLVYITATLLPDGCSAFDLPPVEKTRIKPRQQQNEVCKWYPIENQQDFEAVWNYFYSGADRADVQRAVGLLQPQPFGSISTPNRLTPPRYGAVPRGYVLCTQDPCNRPELQRAMVEAMPCRGVFELPSGHAPFMTHPEELADILCRVEEELRQTKKEVER